MHTGTKKLSTTAVKEKYKFEVVLRYYSNIYKM